MNVACPGCGTKYALLDEKIRGRRVRITCKHCSGPIVVDGTSTSLQPEPGKPQKSVSPSVTAAVKAPTPTSTGAGAGKPNVPASRSPEQGLASPTQRKNSGPSARDAIKADKSVAAVTSGAAAAPRVIRPDKSAALTSGAAAAPRSFDDSTQEPETTTFSLAAEEPATISLDRTSEKPATVRLGRAPQRTATATAATPDEALDRDAGAKPHGVKVPTIRSAHPEPAAGASTSATRMSATSASGRPATRAATPRGFRGTIIGVAEPANSPVHGAPAAALGSARSYSPAPRHDTAPAAAAFAPMPASPSHPPLQRTTTSGASAPAATHHSRPAPPPGPLGAVPRLVAPPSPSRPLVAAAPVCAGSDIRLEGATAVSDGESAPNAIATLATKEATAAAASPKGRETPHTSSAASQMQKPARGMHRTIIGVAAPANTSASDPGPNLRTSVRLPSLQIVAPAGAAVSQALVPNGPQKRAPAANLDLKRTIIGGLEAPSPHAALSGPAAQQLAPTQTKWLVLFPKQGTAEMSEAELVRAYAAGEITRDASVWREGMRDWQQLGKVQSLLPLLQRARISAAPAPTPSTTPNSSDSEKLAAARATSQAPTRTTAEDQTRSPSPPPAREGSQSPSGPSFDNELPTLRHSATLRPTRPSADPPSAETADSAPPTQGARRERFDTGGADEITRISTSPWEVPDVGAKATARLAESAGLPPRQMSIPPTVRGRFDDLPLDRPSRRPDIGPRATVRGQLAALASSVPPARVEHASQASSQSAARMPRDTRMGPFSPASLETSTTGSTRPLELAPISTQEHPSTPAASKRSPSLSITRHKRRLLRRWWFWAALCAGLFTILSVSYRTQQPKALYHYLHVRGWDAPINRTVQRVVPKLGYASSQYVVRPYRAVVAKFKRKSQP